MNAFVIALIVTVGGGIVIQALVHLWAACGLDTIVSLEEAWVRFYTAGLPEAVRDRRRDELKSHLYEAQEYARANGYTPKDIALQLALEWVGGIPDDLSWRLGSIRLVTPLGTWLLALLDRLVAFVECWLPNMLSREYGLILLVGLPIQVALRAWGHYPAALGPIVNPDHYLPAWGVTAMEVVVLTVLALNASTRTYRHFRPTPE